ncbi:putative 2-nitropropane dioxygenase [Cutaneotrichosporon oleaginosum]|uniref:Putative 2-nitropropane dioxygenase n=1 Tax=Cutaneotrichosporon oleaginosum TaxID=879819 RepID=A0A0J0XUX2_9TREE|nr:putative 2-nitropropane dioxygenase [Cutaneotrichosporon oleaginosum]KLT44880.1 putative 2-nitropropane dioxygenase [Cutaneotrichosporon oleaginosum]TXT12011.1 hypothetical protein COLE_02421 [Cutaneotrichosporon oleaginosum]
MAVIRTQLTDMFNIPHPVLLAGMFVASGPRLAAAVTNAGGLGVIGGLALNPKQLRTQIAELKSFLNDKSAPFGIDLALPKIGGGARATNHDYTHGHLNELIDIIVEEKAALFVCAIGVCPPEVVEKLHKGGVKVANMIGHPKHVGPVVKAGVDIVIAQGGEGGGHTGDIPFSVLIPAVVDACSSLKTKKGNSVCVLAAGGVNDGRSLAAALMYGAQGVWVGTRFVASEEAAAPKMHKQQIISAKAGDTTRTLIYSGRPLRVRNTPYVTEWNETRAQEIADLTSRGIIPHDHELSKKPERSIEGKLWLMGEVAGSITEVLPAKVIVDQMVDGAKRCIQGGVSTLNGGAARL